MDDCLNVLSSPGSAPPSVCPSHCGYHRFLDKQPGGLISKLVDAWLWYFSGLTFGLDRLDSSHYLASDWSSRLWHCKKALVKNFYDSSDICQMGFSILYKFFKPPIRHLGLAIRNVWCFLPTLLLAFADKPLIGLSSNLVGHWISIASVPNYCQSVSPKQTTLEEDR